VMIQGRLGCMGPAIDLAEWDGKHGLDHLPELPNAMFINVIYWVLNGNNIVLSPKYLQALYTDLRYWEELIEFFQK